MSRSFITKLTDAPAASTAQRDALASIRWVGNKCYKYVSLLASQGDADVNIAANGDVVGYSDYSGTLVSPDATDCVQGMAGIVVNFANWDGDVSANYSKYMWIQIKGPATLSQSVSGSPGVLGRVAYAVGDTDLTAAKCTTLLMSGGYMTTTTTEIALECPY